VAKTKELKSLLWHRGFKPHAGWETVVLTKKDFVRLRRILHPEEHFDPTIAFVTEIDWNMEHWSGSDVSVPQKYLILREDAGPEIKAHEEAHTKRWEFIRELREDDLVGSIREEILAWLGAQKKRGKKLRSAWLLRVGVQALNDFPGESPVDIVNLMDAILQEEGEKGLTDEVKEKLLEDMEEMDDEIRSRRRKARKQAKTKKKVRGRKRV